MTGSGQVSSRVLIVGWGFLGAAIGQRLLGDGVSVTGLSRSRTWRTEMGRQAGAHMLVGDARDPKLLASALRDIDHVVFSAGGHSPPAAVAHPAEATMALLLPLLSVLEALRHLPHVGLTYMSSGGAVYGNPDRLPVQETAAPRPISPYGASHLAAEGFATMSARRSGSMVQIVRCSNVYGPHQTHTGDQGVVAIFLHRISQQLPIRVFGDGGALLDYVFIDDVADVVSRMVVDRVDTGTVNVGSGVGLTVLEIVAAIGAVTGKDVTVVHEPPRSFDVRSSVLDITRVMSLLPYSPTPFVHGLAATAMAYAASSDDPQAESG